MRKFSELLEEYLSEREILDSPDWHRPIDERAARRLHMQELADELDEMIHGVEK